MADEQDGGAEALTEDDLARAFEDDTPEDDDPVDQAEESDDDEEQDGEEGDDAKSESEDEPPKGRYKVVAKNDDGSTTEQSVSFDELKAGYQRAREAEAVRGQAEQHVLTVQQEAVRQVQTVRAEFDKELRSIDMLVAQALDALSGDHLLTIDDDKEYRRALQRRDALISVKERAKAAREQADQLAQQQQEQVLIARAQRARAELAKAGITGAQVDSIYEKAKEFGFSPQELVQNLDHRLVLVLKDALEFRALKAKKPQVTEKLRTAPKLPPSKTNTARAAPNADLMKRLRTKATGRDLAAYFASQG